MADVSNVEKFFEKYYADADLQKRIDNAVNAYPGSLEIRESLCEEVLLPIAADLGLPFTLSELRKYETRIKMRKNLDVEIDSNEPDDDTIYWLIDRGWTDDEAKFNTDE